MIEGLVSVVIPIYNVEKYLDRCLESVTKQSYSKLEIILVDDGSKDACPDMCDDWAKIDNRIKVIHKKNAGLGMARNTGIESASGEYIYFFDSDDYIALNTIEKCYRAGKNEQADIVLFGFNRLDKNLNVKKIIKAQRQEVYSGADIREKFIPGMVAPNPINGKCIGLWMSMCSALFSMQLIKRANWRCSSEREIISEDMYSLLCLYNDVNRAVVLPDVFYYYCENSDSLTHVYRKDRFTKIKEYYKHCLTACDKYGYDDDIRHRVSKPFLDYTIGALKQITVSENSIQEKKMMVKEIINDDILQEVLYNNMNDKVAINQKILFWFWQKKWISISYLLLRLKA